MAAPSPEALPELPDAVWLKVLELLPFRDRLRAARVCRRWRRLTLDRALWQHLDLTPYQVPCRLLWALLRRQLLGGLRSLQLRGTLLAKGRRQPLSPALLLALGRGCPQLRHLCLAEMNLGALPAPSLPPGLSSLELRRCELPAGWFRPAALPRLRRLVVSRVPAFCDQHLLAATCGGALRSLRLAAAYRLTARGLQRAAAGLRRLRDLALRRCSLGQEALSLILLHCPRLRSLDLSGSFPVPQQGLAALGALQGLEDLSLDLAEGTPPGALLALCRALPCLKRLSLGGAQPGEEVLEELQAALPRCSFSTAA